MCAAVLLGTVLTPEHTRLLARAAQSEVPWSRRLIVCICLAKVRMRTADVAGAARALALAREAYRGFVRLQAKLGVGERPVLLRDYEAFCSRVLAAFEPPAEPGRDPVAAIARLGRSLPRPHAARPQRTIDALDALVALGRIDDPARVEERVAQEIARMLGGRVLLHYVRGGYKVLEGQEIHTLSMWTIRRLVVAEGVRAWRVRRRPEFWRPEQRRPRGVLALPLGAGRVVVARGWGFRASEVRAVRTVLGFLALRLSTPPHAPVPRPELPHGVQPRPTVAEGLVGRSPAWRAVLELVQRAAPSTCSVVLLGATGTGKERLARALHAFSERAQGPFVPVNCGALVPELVASELFGHVRGAFTGAERARDGLFVEAHRGTLFLDELGELPAAAQTALLRVLEERLVTPVGSTRPRPVDVRVVCATHRDMDELVRSRRFREDLWHRLNVLTLRLPTLRERLEDIPLLATHMLMRMPGLKRLHPDATEALARYRWPGNVRELENVLRAATLLADGPEIGPDLLERILDGRRAAVAAQVRPLPPRTAALLEALADRWCSTPELARSLRLSARTINRELATLRARGLVQSVGQARALRYRGSAQAWRDLAPSDR